MNQNPEAKDKLEHIFLLQERFDNELIRLRGLANIGLEEWVQKEVLAILVELGELLEEVNYKWWKNPKPINRAALKEEVVDILHFLVSLCLKAGISAKELYEGYLAKNAENFRRQRGESTKEGYKA